MDKLLAPEPRALTEGGNLPEQWKRFKRTFVQFLVATGRVDKTDSVKIALFLRTIGQRGNDIYESFTWETDADKENNDSGGNMLSMGFDKSTLVARGADTQLDPSCVLAPPATNVDLFACFAERLFKSSFLYMKGKLLTVQAHSQR